ncbi:pyridoxamine 5'-phosphate oxidase family protein [uncultured Roseobacter sp.]|uniref:FAD-binding oxidoreductase n=1 Tax=uncultured Roseobacter sp. TaxID=114847 RepID=UPI0026198E66|nr:pyridoxamine 5'-phosphate oxidase family protein [uncultured Roseobacter sp.]
MLDDANPFHAGERRAQARAGVGDVAEWAAGFIRPAMPDQHRAFFTQLPFLVLAGADADGRHWVTLLDGADGFVGSPDAKTLTIEATPSAQDPLAAALTRGTDIGLLGIELATRRRNRLSGTFRRHGTGYAIDVRQSFGNCPQYIHERTWQRVPLSETPPALSSATLSETQIARIRAADTLFLGTGQRAEEAHASNGFDASHRGGAPGFVKVVDATHLRIPDYAGNNFFNSIGNPLENPAIGLVFVDFETGGLLHLSGRAAIDWDPTDSRDPNAQRMIDVTIDVVVDRPNALSLRWSRDDEGLRALVVTRKVVEAEGITSFYLAAADGAPLAPFEAGQHLPVELEIPGQPGLVKRSYSLSGSPNADTYRLSIKREVHGIVSGFFHDHVQVGSRIAARTPSGDFMAPCSDCPLVLASAGVGLTPMLSMLNAAAAQQVNRPVWYVHGVRNGAQHAFKSEVDALVTSRPNLTKHIQYSQPMDTETAGIDFDATGRVTAQTLLDLNAGPGAQYLLCGPAQWIASLRTGLETAGVPAHHIHFETFGPTG